MKYSLPGFLLFFCSIGFKVQAQQVYVTEWKSDAVAQVYVTEWKSDADLVVYVSEWKSDADKKNEGIWYFTTWKSEGKQIYYTEWKSDADIIVYFSKWKSDAGWVNKKKQHLLAPK
ncbi:MAG: hypothetical protein BGO31_00545 [Bacteroidetes bacterium 43-16]|mgnify:CR=1 FL=1|nr:MAG: hypothetical protein BGO31_00545 [Bacteroidetes bacterium 43-16]